MAVAFQLPLRGIRLLRLDYDRSERRHQVFFEDQEGNCVRREIQRIGEWLSRLSHCYIHLLNLWPIDINTFGRRQFDDDLEHCHPVNTHVKKLEVWGKCKSASFHVRLYKFLMLPAHMAENIEINEFLPNAMLLGLKLPQTIESKISGTAIVEGFLESRQPTEGLRFIYLNNSSFLKQELERRAGFWYDENCREARIFVDGLSELSPVTVYRPLTNRFSGQKLRVMAMQSSEPYPFTSEAKLVLRDVSDAYAEANCVFMFACWHGWRGMRPRLFHLPSYSVRLL